MTKLSVPKLLFSAAFACALLNSRAWITDASAADDNGRVYYKDGMRLEAGDTELKLNAQLQPRFEFFDYDSEDRENTSGTRMRRARLIASGTLLDKQFSFMLNNDFASDSGGGDLKDAWLQWNGQATNLRFGRMKIPLTRQSFTSSSKLFFADRAFNDDFFFADRDQGAMAHGKIGETGMYYAGVFNGDSDGENDRKAPVDNTINGIVALDFSTANYGSRGEEGDMRSDGELGATAGAAVLYGQGETLVGDEETGLVTDFDQLRINGDLGIRCHGADVQAEVSYRTVELDGSDDSPDEIGFYVQAAQMLDKNWGLGARYGIYNPDDNEVDTVSEYTLGLDYFIAGHRLKLQNQASFRITELEDGSEDDEKEFRYILQLAAFI